MTPAGSVTRWIDLLKAGERTAAGPLFDRYFRQLVRLARQKLRNAPRAVADEEDVALSAFKSFCCAAECGQFRQLIDRNDLSHLLVLLTVRKAIALIQRERRKKRGGGRVQPMPADGDAAVVHFLSKESPPDIATQTAEQMQRLLDCLPNARLRLVADLKLQGYTNEEIAQRLRCVLRTVERRLNVIRSVWIEEVAR
jgi:DNA-directed RNA polymerase specialized sigma24 family protein